MVWYEEENKLAIFFFLQGQMSSNLLKICRLPTWSELYSPLILYFILHLLQTLFHTFDMKETPVYCRYAGHILQSKDCMSSRHIDKSGDTCQPCLDFMKTLSTVSLFYCE